ncbi:MAG: YigZ family protein [Clostridia bacterium]|nr:YigZ family protein [Clostridia bacterium]
MSEAVLRTVWQDFEAEIDEKRSTFIAAVRRVENEEEALAFVKERRKLHPDARHTVFAYLLRNGAARYADDAEPQGTAGLPTLEAIRRTGLVDVCVATARYFGGILLGAGGLTRAYGGAAHAVLEGAKRAEYIPLSYFLLDCTYAEHPKLENELARFGVEEQSAEFSDRVQIRVGVRAPRGDVLCARIVELTAGRCTPEKLEECTVLVPMA